METLNTDYYLLENISLADFEEVSMERLQSVEGGVFPLIPIAAGFAAGFTGTGAVILTAHALWNIKK